MDKLVAMKAELAMMGEEKIYMEEWLIAAGHELEEQKKVVSECKAVAKSVDDLVDVFIESVGDKPEEYGPQSLDDETMRGLIEKAMSDFNQVWKKAQNLGNSGGGAGNIGGGHEGSSGNNNFDIVSKALDSDGGEKTDASGGGHSE